MYSLEQRFINIISSLKTIPQLNKYIKKILSTDNSSDNSSNKSSFSNIKKLIHEIIKIIDSDSDTHLSEISLTIQSLSRLLQLKPFKFKNNILVDIVSL